MYVFGVRQDRRGPSCLPLPVAIELLLGRGCATARPGSTVCLTESILSVLSSPPSTADAIPIPISSLTCSASALSSGSRTSPPTSSPPLRLCTTSSGNTWPKSCSGAALMPLPNAKGRPLPGERPAETIVVFIVSPASVPVRRRP
jgi:hypothetical protein